MKKIKVNVREILERVVEVEAIDEDDALDKVSDLYKDGEIILDSNDFVDKEITLF